MEVIFSFWKKHETLYSKLIIEKIVIVVCFNIGVKIVDFSKCKISLIYFLKCLTNFLKFPIKCCTKFPQILYKILTKFFKTF